MMGKGRERDRERCLAAWENWSLEGVENKRVWRAMKVELQWLVRGERRESEGKKKRRKKEKERERKEERIRAR